MNVTIPKLCLYTATKLMCDPERQKWDKGGLKKNQI